MSGLNSGMQKLMDEYDALDTQKSGTVTGMTHALGMCFNGNNIYFAELERADRTVIVNKYGMVPTSMKFGTGIEGVEKNIREICSFLNGFIDSQNIKARHLNLCFNTHLITLHKFKVLNTSNRAEMEDFIKWEFGQQVIDDVHQFMVNTHVMEETETAQIVLTVGIRKKIVETLVHVLEKSKIQLVNMDVDILCSHATYELNYDPDPRGLTVLAESKAGMVTFLICSDYEVRDIYQFIAPAKSTLDNLGDLINHHLGNALLIYNQTHSQSASISRVILCQIFSQDILPYIGPQYRPEVINPFNKLIKSEPFETEESTENKDESRPIKTVTEDYSLYAEAIGAAAKLLVNEKS
jgi:hypothetical protein